MFYSSLRSRPTVTRLILTPQIALVRPFDCDTVLEGHRAKLATKYRIKIVGKLRELIGLLD
jgi:hypothetical protein